MPSILVNTILLLICVNLLFTSQKCCWQAIKWSLINNGDPVAIVLSPVNYGLCRWLIIGHCRRRRSDQTRVCYDGAGAIFYQTTNGIIANFFIIIACFILHAMQRMIYCTSPSRVCLLTFQRVVLRIIKLTDLESIMSRFTKRMDLT